MKNFIAAWSLLFLLLAPPVFAQSGDTPSGELNTSDAAIDGKSDIAVPRGMNLTHSVVKNKPAGVPAFDWKPAINESFRFLTIQHAFRMATEPGTRDEMRGPFVKDYFHSLRGLSGWGDGDPFIVNYVGHPMMGAVSGFIHVQNDKVGRTAKIGRSREYWNSRLRAMAFAAAYSLQFELGPYSEAALGNVGLDRKTMGWVDLVITPTGGTAWLIMEDALDAALATRLERLANNAVWKASVRSMLNPARSFTNVLRGRAPWHRDM
jgi:hypothetical protein